MPRRRDLDGWERNLVALFLAQTVSVVGFSLVFPFLPLYVAELGVRGGGSVELWSGLAYSAQAAVMLVAAPIWGALADRWGRKVMIERAMFGGALVVGLMGFARSAEELVLLRAIQGAVTGVIPAANALVAATAPRERSGRALGLMQASVWTGASLGPLLGGVLADTAGFRSAFLLTGLLLAAAGAAVSITVREEGSLAEGTGPGIGGVLGSWRRVLAGRGLRAVYAVRFVVRLARFMILPVAPLLVAKLAPGNGHTATLAGVFTAAMSMAGIASSALLGGLGDRIGHGRVLVAGCVASALAYSPFLWVGGIWQMLALAVPIGVAQGAVVPSISALLARASPRGGQGTVYGFDASVNAGARMVAPLVASSVAMAAGLRAGVTAAGVAFLLAAAVAFLALPMTPPHQAAVTGAARAPDRAA